MWLAYINVVHRKINNVKLSDVSLFLKDLKDFKDLKIIVTALIYFNKTDALQESLSKLKEIVPTIEETIIKQVVKKSSAGLDTARNIPRLYRRTNKEVQ